MKKEKEHKLLVHMFQVCLSKLKFTSVVNQPLVNLIHSLTLAIPPSSLTLPLPSVTSHTATPPITSHTATPLRHLSHCHSTHHLSHCHFPRHLSHCHSPRHLSHCHAPLSPLTLPLHPSPLTLPLSPSPLTLPLPRSPLTLPLPCRLLHCHSLLLLPVMAYFLCSTGLLLYKCSNTLDFFSPSKKITSVPTVKFPPQTCNYVTPSFSDSPASNSFHT